MYSILRSAATETETADRYLQSYLLIGSQFLPPPRRPPDSIRFDSYPTAILPRWGIQNDSGSRMEVRGLPHQGGRPCLQQVCHAGGGATKGRALREARDSECCPRGRREGDTGASCCRPPRGAASKRGCGGAPSQGASPKVLPEGCTRFDRAIYASDGGGARK